MLLNWVKTESQRATGCAQQDLVAGRGDICWQLVMHRCCATAFHPGRISRTSCNVWIWRMTWDVCYPFLSTLTAWWSTTYDENQAG